MSEAGDRLRRKLERKLEREVNAALMERLRADAERIAAHFGLRYRALEPERRNVKSRYGVCYSDGTIRIRLRHATSGRPLKYSSLISTLCHELAHLRYFHHGETFRAYYARLLEWAKREGIYRAGAPARRTVQLELQLDLAHGAEPGRGPGPGAAGGAGGRDPRAGLR